MKTSVLIKKCSDDTMWYSNKIGEKYEFLFIDTFDNENVVVELSDGLGSRGSIRLEDCELTEVGDDVIIRPDIVIPKEEDVLKKKITTLEEELALTQQMINTMLNI